MIADPFTTMLKIANSLKNLQTSVDVTKINDIMDKNIAKSITS